jgi:replication factor A1
VRLHYALVDDLYSSEEYERLIGETIEASGGLLDEQTAAMVVVRAAGREHRPIAKLESDASLACFFGKVLTVSEPRTFDRADGTQGCVARVRVGDETGEITLILWDERTGAVTEIAPGDVLEIAGRLRSPAEVQVVDLQKAACDIATREGGVSGEVPHADRVTLEVRVLFAGDVQTYIRRDGTPGERIDVIVGDANGTARLVCWHPPLFEHFSHAPPGTVRIEGAAPNPRTGGREYSLGEQALVQAVDLPVTVPFTPPSMLVEGKHVSSAGEVVAVRPPREFETRKGTRSHVRNITVGSGGVIVPVVLWGEHALLPFAPGDTVEVYNAPVKRTKSGECELHVGWGSAIRVVMTEDEPVTFTGTVIETSLGLCIDDGETAFLLHTPLPVGAEVQVTGRRSQNRITVGTCTPVAIVPALLKERIARILRKASV